MLVLFVRIKNLFIICLMIDVAVVKMFVVALYTLTLNSSSAIVIVAILKKNSYINH